MFKRIAHFEDEDVAPETLDNLSNNKGEE